MSTRDLEEVLEIESVSFSNPWRPQDFTYALYQPHSVARVCRHTDQLLGYAVGFVKGEELHLADFAIRPDRHRKGYGATLLQLVIDEAREGGYKAITLEVRQSNQAAIRMYERAGFHTVAIRRAYYSRPREDALVMVKALTGKLSDWISQALHKTFPIGESD